MFEMVKLSWQYQTSATATLVLLQIKKKITHWFIIYIWVRQVKGKLMCSNYQFLKLIFTVFKYFNTVIKFC